MEAIHQKLHSQRGASMLLALVFLLVGLSVGAVALTAATANSGRIQREWKDQQNYLALESAMKLLKEDLQSLKFHGEYGHVETTTITTYPPSKNEGTGEITPGSTESKTEISCPRENIVCKLEGSELFTEDQMNLQPAYLTYFPVSEEDKTALKDNVGNLQPSISLPLSFEAKTVEGFPQVSGTLEFITSDDDPRGECFTILGELYVGKPKTKEDSATPFLTSFILQPTKDFQSTPLMPKTSQKGNSEIIEQVTTHSIEVSWPEIIIQKGGMPRAK